MADGNEELFETYLYKSAPRVGGGTVSKSSARSYLSTLQALSRTLNAAGIIHESLFQIDDMKKLVQIHEEILHGSTAISQQNQTQHRIISAALYQYINMLSLLPQDDIFEEIERPMAAYLDGSFDLGHVTNDGLIKLYEKSLEKPNGKDATSIVQARRDRSDAVKQITLGRANNDCCDLCGKQSFELPNGHHFLECHHLIYLSKNGPDSIINTVALCPNCHRMMHLGLLKDRDDSFKELLDIVYHYLKNETELDPNLPNQFASLFHYGNSNPIII